MLKVKQGREYYKERSQCIILIFQAQDLYTNVILSDKSFLQACVNKSVPVIIWKTRTINWNHLGSFDPTRLPTSFELKSNLISW